MFDYKEPNDFTFFVKLNNVGCHFVQYSYSPDYICFVDMFLISARNNCLFSVFRNSKMTSVSLYLSILLGLLSVIEVMSACYNFPGKLM